MAARTKAAVVVVVVVVVLGVVTVVVFAALCVRIIRLDKSASSFYTDVEQLASFYPHHEYVVNAARALPLEPKRDDDVERVSKKREQREGGFQRSLLGCMYWAKTTPRKQTGRKTDPFGRLFFSRPLATCFPHFI